MQEIDPQFTHLPIVTIDNLHEVIFRRNGNYPKPVYKVYTDTGIYYCVYNNHFDRMIIEHKNPIELTDKMVEWIHKDFTIVEWAVLFHCCNVPENLIEQYFFVMNIGEFLMCKPSEDLLRKLANNIDWSYITNRMDLTDEFITEMQLRGYITD